MMNKLVNIVLLVSALCACGQKNVPARNVLESEKMSLNQLAERYVKLTLAVGKHSPSYIDAYYGPQEWQQQAADKSLEMLKQEVLDLVKDIDTSTADNNESTRKTFLLVQLLKIPLTF